MTSEARRNKGGNIRLNITTSAGVKCIIVHKEGREGCRRRGERPVLRARGQRIGSGVSERKCIGGSCVGARIGNGRWLREGEENVM